MSKLTFALIMVLVLTGAEIPQAFADSTSVKPRCARERGTTDFWKSCVMIDILNRGRRACWC